MVILYRVSRYICTWHIINLQWARPGLSSNWTVVNDEQWLLVIEFPNNGLIGVGSDVNATIESGQFNDIYGFSVTKRYMFVSSWRVARLSGSSFVFSFSRAQPSTYFTWIAIGY